MKLRELFEGLPVKRYLGSDNPEITGLAVDSRKVRPGYLYLALVGARDDGHRYLSDAIERGARAVVLQKESETAGGVPTVLVETTQRVLPEIAGRFFRFPARKLRIVGITGTNGKTTTSYLIESVLAAAGRKSGVIGTINYRIADRQIPAGNTTPGNLELQEMFSQMVEAKCRYAVMEVSSHALVQGRIEGIPLDAAIFTNASPHEHLDYHGRYRHYLAAKSLLFNYYLARSDKENRLAVINRDDRQARFFRRAVPAGARPVSFGFRRGALVRGFALAELANGISLRALTPAGEIGLMVNLPGRHNAYNALAAVAFGIGEGLSLESIRQGIENLRVVPGRFEEVETDRGFRVVVDYAHTDVGLTSLLLTARAVLRSSDRPGRVILAFGCGGDRDRSKRPKMGEVAARLADLTILTSDNPRSEEPEAIIRDIAAGIPANRRDRVEVVADRQSAIQRALELARPGDLVLIAGKGHETYQILKDTVIPFDDRLAVRKALAGLKGA
ncbi:MAG: UDP-N-acetylmuramoyl-L-alanyl-D-glutamate--L-lysine ligase [candidate division TA06 bacterium ADurb.Bin417]|uniref:UDP-N-acetylmuramoyl-L-alanyl-D-glutamate--2,6-diaminopimelate ligase n=1 Tax=candidate division TA06 bacterium ADurb.Bin417 TaxID=1852828 RepID=A0A1V5MLP9_UNCT6|nr:MAG: UDP-N-acetylmuramoyl-L-alanyl-D-glutamate--L-lysine ligase [candidate division TA06 bacterium ADurb.Bin417]